MNEQKKTLQDNKLTDDQIEQVSGGAHLMDFASNIPEEIIPEKKTKKILPKETKGHSLRNL